MEFNNFCFDKELILKKALKLNSPSRLCLEHDAFTHGAVSFLILPYKGTNKPYNLVLIKRTHRKGDKHSGEMSFPGGKFERKKDNTYLDTALRETEEELGIPRENIKILGALNDHITPKFFIITPIIAYINPEQSMIKQESEVREIIKIPITFFANKKNYKERQYHLGENKIAVGKYVYRPSNDKKYTIFGATSHIIVSFLQRIYDLQLMKPGYRRLDCDDLNKKNERKINSSYP
jgi:8-oxo-dGTP pyrophosphatase MutT (NUDIX family)